MKTLLIAIALIATFHLPTRAQGLNDAKIVEEGVQGSGIQVEQARQQLHAQRAALERQREHDDGQCFQRFAVNDCRADVRTRYRTVSADLKRQELLLNDMERRDKGLQRLQQLEDKAARAADQAESTEDRPAAPTRAEKAAPVPRKAETAAARGSRPDDTQSQADAAARWSTRQQEAAQRREKSAERQAKRKSAPLPPPADTR